MRQFEYLTPFLPFAAILIAAVLALTVFRVLIAKSKARSKNDGFHLAYDRNLALLTSAELAFFKVLYAATSPWFYIAPKVRLFDLIQPRSGLTKSAAATARNITMQRHVDFVLCKPENMEPVAVIELDDSSHLKPSRQAKDRELNEALSSAALPLLRVPWATSYSVQEVTEKIKLTLQL